MEKENIKQEEKREVAMVECPFCNKGIEAPSKADIIFKCPHCFKELITYDKTQESPKKQIQHDDNNVKKKKQILIWGCIIAFIGLLFYTSVADTSHMYATYIIIQDYDAAIDVETEKALVKAAVDGDKMKTLEIVGNKQTIHFFKGDRVKITRDMIRGLPDYYRVERLSDGASALIPQKHLKKE